VMKKSDKPAWKGPSTKKAEKAAPEKVIVMPNGFKLDTVTWLPVEDTSRKEASKAKPKKTANWLKGSAGGTDSTADGVRSMDASVVSQRGCFEVRGWQGVMRHEEDPRIAQKVINEKKFYSSTPDMVVPRRLDPEPAPKEFLQPTPAKEPVQEEQEEPSEQSVREPEADATYSSGLVPPNPRHAFRPIPAFGQSTIQRME